MDHTFSQPISVILSVLSDGPRWRQVASLGSATTANKTNCKYRGHHFFSPVHKTLLYKGSLKIKSFYRIICQANRLCNNPQWRQVASQDPHLVATPSAAFSGHADFCCENEGSVFSRGFHHRNRFIGCSTLLPKSKNNWLFIGTVYGRDLNRFNT